MNATPTSVESLGERVVALESVRDEPPKPWYRQPSNFFSILALILSLAGFVFTQIHDRQQDRRAKNEELRKLVVDLIEIHQQAQKEMSPESLGGQLFSAKQDTLLSAAELLEVQVRADTSAAEYVILASEEASRNRPEKSREFLKRAAVTASTIDQHIEALVNLAASHFFAGGAKEIDLGRQTYQQALALLTGDDLPSSVLKGRINEAWAASEFHNGDQAASVTKEAAAKHFYEMMPITDPQRHPYINGLPQRVKTGVGAEQIAATGTAIAPSCNDVMQPPVKLSMSEVQWIMDNPLEDGGTSYYSDGTDAADNAKLRQQVEHLASLGLVRFVSVHDLKQAEKKNHERYSYGYVGTDLLNSTKNFLLGAIDRTLQCSSASRS